MLDAAEGYYLQRLAEHHQRTARSVRCVWWTLMRPSTLPG
jgi:hypothetical protein